ncbi:MAG: alpha/beta fold hydrolase [Cypionkella sp.]
MTLSYIRQGQGAPLVLVHGYLAGSAIWAAERATLSQHYDVICPDLAGFGQSAALLAPETIAGHAQNVLDLLDSLGITDFALLGHSMGGMVVQDMARLAPHRIHTLILYGTGPQGVLPGRFETIDQSRARIIADGLGPTARRIAATWFLQGEAAAGFALCAALGQQTTFQAALASLTAWQHWDGRAALAQIRARTLVLWGSHDRSYEWSQPHALWRGIPKADLAVVPGCAHNVHMEKPQLFHALLLDFLAHPPAL